jgi:glycosyltransferase involved in cell wall biosynthesis
MKDLQVADGSGLVAVVTPFHNAAPYLRECIESVLRQTWTNFSYVLVDNQSSDGSLDIAKEYADKDSRITVISTQRLLQQRDNFNFAMSHAPTKAAYCKLLCADDWMFPECLERMIEVAERDPRIGLVSSYHLVGTQIGGTGLPYDKTVYEGSDICRRQLLQGYFFFGSPTAVLYRGDVLRERRPFFNADSLHEDTEACYEILAARKFGFVHQILTYMRVDPTSTSGRVRNLNPRGLDKLICLIKYGSIHLNPSEFRAALAAHEKTYYRGYVRGLFSRSRKEFRQYHEAGHQRIGYRLRRTALIRAACIETANTLLNPLHTLAQLRAKVAWRHNNLRSTDNPR